MNQEKKIDELTNELRNIAKNTFPNVQNLVPNTKTKARKPLSEAQKIKQTEACKRYRERHREELKRKSLEYYQSNKERLNNDPVRLAKIAEWQKEHPERTKATQKRYHESHKEQKAAYGEKYRAQNKEKILEREKRWRENNPEKYRAKIKAQTEKLRASGYITNRILFKAKRILLEKNPRTGICQMCEKKGRTEIHHIKYHDADPLRDTIEVCARCHRLREQLYGEWKRRQDK